VKDNICTRTFPTTCASNSLHKFSSPFNATVVNLLENSGAIIAGKTNLDEFGMGSHSTHSRFGAVQNSIRQAGDKAVSAGGSSGGSAVAVATGQCYA
jgi:aspartyl-tRNA(Asn)/glutamyl-tRNA(Gln) amidotransferase subunit A